MKSGLKHAVTVITTLALLGMVVLPVFARPAGQDNLLKNGDFEGNYYFAFNNEKLSVPESWEPWWDNNTDGCYNWPPQYNATTNQSRVQAGSKAASMWAKGAGYGFSFTGGLVQVVSGVQSGATYRFTIYIRAWSTENPAVETSTANTPVRIGIDKKGTKFPLADSIVWSGTVTPMDQYQQITVEAVAESDTINVITYAKPDYCVEQNDVYFDSASLILVSGAGTQASAGPTQIPSSGVPVGSIPVAAPRADGSVVHTVNAGETLIGITITYDQAYGGVTMESIRQLNSMTSDIIRVGQQLIIKPAGGAASPTEAPAAEATADPAAQPTTEPAVEPTTEPPAVVEETGSGTICVMSYEDVNGDGIRQPEEDRLGGITFVVNNGAETVATYTTTGTAEPYCFVELTPGGYTIAWTGDNYTATTDQTWSTTVVAGATVQRDFGAQSIDGAEEINEPASGGGIPNWLLALLGAFGVMLVLGGIGVGGYFFMMRGSQKI